MASTDDVSFSTKQVSDILNVRESTLRKYCVIMQNNGYRFEKNGSGVRIFFERDISIFRNMLDLKNNGGLTVENAVKAALSDIVDTESNTTDIMDLSAEEILEEFTSFKAEQQRFNEELLKELKRQQDYIKNSIEERDKNLLLAIQEIQETKQQIASAKEKKWWQFWK